MDAATRAQASHVVYELGAQIHRGQLVHRAAGVQCDRARLTALLQQCVALIQRLQLDKSEIRARLAHNIDTEPCASVRRLNCRTLLDEYGLPDDLVADALRRGQAHADPCIRVLFAACLPVEAAMQVLRPAIYFSKFDPETRMTAVELMVSRLSGPLVEAALAEIFAGDVVELQLGAAQVLYKTGHRALLEIGLSALELPLKPEVLLVLVQALWSHPGTVTQSSLLCLIEHEEAQIVCAGARGLAQVGDVEAVPPLLAVAEGLFVGGDVKTTVRAAVAQIQSRLAGCGAGALSVVDSGAQGLAIVGPESGALSLGVGGPEGTLSLQDDTEDQAR